MFKCCYDWCHEHVIPQWLKDKLNPKVFTVIIWEPASFNDEDLRERHCWVKVGTSERYEKWTDNIFIKVFSSEKEARLSVPTHPLVSHVIITPSEKR